MSLSNFFLSIRLVLQSDFEMEVEIDDDAEARRRFESCLPENWVLCSSKTHSGRLYYFNSVTGESRWEHPLIPDIDSPVSHINFLNVVIWQPGPARGLGYSVFGAVQFRYMVFFCYNIFRV